MSFDQRAPTPEPLSRYLADIQDYQVLTADNEARLGRLKRLAFRGLQRRITVLEAALHRRGAPGCRLRTGGHLRDGEPSRLGGDSGAGRRMGMASLEQKARDLLRDQDVWKDPRTAELARRIRKSLQELWDSREALVRSQLRFVVFIARRYASSGLPLLDLIQEGNVGLMKAVDNFDERRETRLATYSAWWIRQAIHRAVLQSQGPVAIPVKLEESRRRAAHARNELRAELGREPTREEISDSIQEEVPDFEQRAAFSLDDEDLSLGALQRMLEDANAPCPIHQLQLREARDEIRQGLRGLPQRERMIIRLRYGFERGDGQTLDEIGKSLSLSRERIRQIEQGAIGKLRRRPPLARVAEAITA